MGLNIESCDTPYVIGKKVRNMGTCSCRMRSLLQVVFESECIDIRITEFVY